MFRTSLRSMRAAWRTLTFGQRPRNPWARRERRAPPLLLREQQRNAATPIKDNRHLPIVYGDTPPALVAVGSSLLDGPTGFRQVAWALEREAQRRPVWAVLGASPELLHIGAGGWDDAMRSLADAPDWDPPPSTGRSTPAVEGTAAVLAYHLDAVGLQPKLAGYEEARQIPRPSLALAVAGGALPATATAAALALAEEMSIKQVRVWRRDPLGPTLKAAAKRAGIHLIVEDPAKSLVA